MPDEVLSQFTQTVREEKKAAPVKKFRYGIIGTGWIAEAHAQVLKNMEDVEVVAMADLIPGKAERFADTWGFDKSKINFYPSHKEMIDNEQLDGVSVCTYNRTHAECTIYALEHGVNVLLEKPFTVTTEEAVACCRAEKKSGKLLSIGFQPRMDRNMQEIKRIVESGELGQVYYIRIGGGRRRGIPNSTFIEQKTAGIGALGDIGCYALDMVLNAIGYPKPLTVTGYKSAFFGANPKYNNPADAARFNVDDFAAGFVRLEGGIVVDFITAWASHIDTPGDTIILGTEGALRIPSTECWNGSVGGPMTLYKDIAGFSTQVTVPLRGDVPGGLFFQKVRSFVDACREGRPAPVPSSQILYNQAIIDGISRSAELGREIEIEIPEI